jgi:hypothetical protein
MSAKPIPDFVFTPHARAEIDTTQAERRDRALRAAAPGAALGAAPGRHVVQRRLSMGDPPKPYVVRVFVDIDRTPCEVVTAYRTSKTAKYWRDEP